SPDREGQLVGARPGHDAPTLPDPIGRRIEAQVPLVAPDPGPGREGGSVAVPAVEGRYLQGHRTLGRLAEPIGDDGIVLMRRARQERRRLEASGVLAAEPEVTPLPPSAPVLPERGHSLL